MNENYPRDTRILGAAQCATQAVNLPIARRVLDRNEELAAALHATADRLTGKLEAVVGQDQTKTAAGRDSPMPPQEYYPPLFDGFRTTQDSMDAALSRIHQLLDRIEL